MKNQMDRNIWASSASGQQYRAIQCEANGQAPRDILTWKFAEKKQILSEEIQTRELPMSIDTIMSDFAFLDEWEDRYRYVIELGRALPALSAAEKTDATKVRGCASQVWLVSEKDVSDNQDDPILIFRGESDAHIVQGLIAILLAIYNNKHASEIRTIDTEAIFTRLGLTDNLTPQRSNGLKSMIQRIRDEAATAC